MDIFKKKNFLFYFIVHKIKETRRKFQAIAYELLYMK